MKLRTARHEYCLDIAIRVALRGREGEVMPESCDDIRVLVTGGGQGIGLGIARSFARVGAKVAIANRSRDRLDETRRRLADEGLKIETIVADISTRSGCADMVEQTTRALGGLDVLCSNAGIYPEQPIEDLTEEDVESVLATNLKGTIFSVQASIPALAVSGRGRVVVTSSITGPTTGFPGLSIYGASKSAQLGFIRTAALELAKRGITINAISPGSVRTEGLDGFDAETIAGMTKAIPTGRLGEPEEIGATAVFLASRSAAFITGQEITVDGGQTLPEVPDLV